MGRTPDEEVVMEREGDSMVYSAVHGNESITEELIETSESRGDNHVFRSESEIFVYEAPSDIDPHRGYLITLDAETLDVIQCESGLDSQVFGQFQAVKNVD